MTSVSIRVDTADQAGEARRRAASVAASLRLDETTAGRVALENPVVLALVKQLVAALVRQVPAGQARQVVAVLPRQVEVVEKEAQTRSVAINRPRAAAVAPSLVGVGALLKPRATEVAVA